MLIVLAALLVATLAPAASVSGVIRLRGARTPVAGVAVYARAAVSSDLYQSAVTDAAGRYQLAGLPGARLSLSVSKPGYVARARASGAWQLVLQLAPAESFDGADFELVAGGVVTGRITDPSGEPAEGVRVALMRVTEVGERRRGSASAGFSDDRGVYRIFGLEPGRYLLRAGPLPGVAEFRAGALYYPGTSEPARATPIDVRAATELTGIDLALGAEPGVRLSGRLVDYESHPRLPVRFSLAALDAEGRMSYYTNLEARGEFRFSGLAPGAYLLTAVVANPGGGGSRTVARQRVELRADLAGLVVRPSRPASLAGRVVFAGAASREPVRLTVSAGGESAAATAAPPEFRFEFAELDPGAWRLEVAGPAQAYLQEVRTRDQKAAREIQLGEGARVEVEAMVGLDRANLDGAVRASGESNSAPLPHATVALAGADGPDAPHTTLADQNGRFSFSGLRPGRYALCAWPAEPDWLDDPQVCGRAGAAARAVTLEPGARARFDVAAALPSP